MSRRRRPWTWILILAFVVLPLLEIYVLIQVGQVIGGGWAFLLLVVDSIIGGWLVKREGTRAWRELVGTLQQGHSPHRELADGALVLVAGTLMLTPGFVTDIFGAFLLLPFTRPFARKALSAVIARRLLRGGITSSEGYVAGGFGPGFEQTGFGFTTTSWDASRPRGTASGSDDVVEGKVVDD